MIDNVRWKRTETTVDYLPICSGLQQRMRAEVFYSRELYTKAEQVNVTRCASKR